MSVARPAVPDPPPRMRAFVGIGVLLALVYSALGTWSVGQAFGGVDADGGWIDFDGNPTATAPLQVDVTGHPGAWVFAVVALLLVAAYLISRRGARATLKASIGCVVAALFVAAVVGVFTFWQMHLIGEAFQAGVTTPPMLIDADVVVSRMRAG